MLAFELSFCSFQLSSGTKRMDGTLVQYTVMKWVVYDGRTDGIVLAFGIIRGGVTFLHARYPLG